MSSISLKKRQYSKTWRSSLFKRHASASPVSFQNYAFTTHRPSCHLIKLFLFFFYFCSNLPSLFFFPFLLHLPPSPFCNCNVDSKTSILQQFFFSRLSLFKRDSVKRIPRAFLTFRELTLLKRCWLRFLQPLFVIYFVGACIRDVGNIILCVVLSRFRTIYVFKWNKTTRQDKAVV